MPRAGTYRQARARLRMHLPTPAPRTCALACLLLHAAGTSHSRTSMISSAASAAAQPHEHSGRRQLPGATADEGIGPVALHDAALGLEQSAPREAEALYRRALQLRPAQARKKAFLAPRIAS